MNKLITLMLGLSVALGTVSLFAQDAPKSDTTKTEKKKKSSKPKKDTAKKDTTR